MQAAPNIYRLKEGAFRPAWWPINKDSCQFRCYMCGSNYIAQEELHDVNPRCQECKNDLRLQLEEEERQQTAEDNAYARRDEPSSGESLFSTEDTEETSICTPRNDWFECNYPSIIICSQCQQPHDGKEGCRPQDMKSRLERWR